MKEPTLSDLSCVELKNALRSMKEVEEIKKVKTPYTVVGFCRYCFYWKMERYNLHSGQSESIYVSNHGQGDPECTHTIIRANSNIDFLITILDRL